MTVPPNEEGDRSRTKYAPSVLLRRPAFFFQGSDRGLFLDSCALDSLAINSAIGLCDPIDRQKFKSPACQQKRLILNRGKRTMLGNGVTRPLDSFKTVI